MELERLQKVIAERTRYSRREAEELIAAGRIRVNGRLVTELGTKVLPVDTIELDGRPLWERLRHLYLMLNKPRGFLTSREDPGRRRLVMDLVPFKEARPVGRLDYDSEGLLLLTTDGDLIQALTHPSHQVPKTYLFGTRESLSHQALAQLRRGVLLDDGHTAPAQVCRSDAGYVITIAEGRYRQVRRMVRAVGGQVTRLTRVSIADLELGRLPSGKWRYLTQLEVERLRQAAGLGQVRRPAPSS